MPFPIIGKTPSSDRVVSGFRYLVSEIHPSPAGFDFASAGLFAEPPLNTPQLHAYWRMAYIEAPRYPAELKRPFSELPALGDDRAALIIHRSVHSYLLLNRFPYNPGHLLAVPYREVNGLEDLTPAERADLMEEIVVGRQLLQAAVKPNGFNLGFNLGSAAGGSIAHLHGHIVPRWNGDNNFMPVLGHTRILPQSLQSMWDRLSGDRATLHLPKPKAAAKPRKRR
jgi:ATP adenylyltransferase